MLKEIDAVIFDMDGTIIDSVWVWKQVDSDYLSKRGFEVPDDLQRHVEGLSFTETAEYFKKRFNLKENVEEIKKEWHDMVKEYYQSAIDAKKGVKEFLVYLKENGYKIAMATSNNKELVEVVLKRNDLLEFFEVVVTTCEVPRDKSFPDVFLETAKRINAEPSKCLVFEDTIAGLTGAKAANMRVVAVYDEYGSCTIDELKSFSDNLIENFENIIKD